MAVPTVDSTPTLAQTAQVGTLPEGDAPALPPGSEPWVHAWLCARLSDPLSAMIATLSDEQARYMQAFIERMRGPLAELLEAWNLPPVKEPFWELQVLPLLKRKLHPPPRRWTDATDPFKRAKANTDIVEFAGRFTDLEPRGSKFVGLCPLHDEKTGSFHINPERQSWKCFGACGRGGDVIELGRLLMVAGKW